jgi:hypothetical protein
MRSWAVICRKRGIGLWRPDGDRNPSYDQLRDELGCTRAWQCWSTTLSASLQLAARIDKMPARTVAGLEVRFRALLWRLTYDDDLLDDDHRRALQAFGRGIAEMAHSARVLI